MVFKTMKTEKNNIYNKHNSFFKFVDRNLENEKKLLNRIEGLLNEDKLIDLNHKEKDIILNVKKDLYKNNSPSNERFKLSPNVVKEIQTLKNDDIPRYLVHRYRYEIYPLKKIIDDYPPFLQIEPTSICNYRCVFCYQTDNFFNKRSNGFMGHMTLDMFKKIIDQAEGVIEFISIASRGEPLMCPEINKMLEYTCGKFLNLKINTNASILSEEKSHAILKSGIKTVVFSADAADDELYSKLRVNGKLSKILSNIEKFKKIKETHYPDSNIITRVSGVKINEKQKLDDMESYWGGLVDQVAFVNYIPWENVYGSPINSINTPCSDLWRRMFVWWDGKINPCDVDYKSFLSTGNILNDNLSKLWRSNNYEKIRQKHLKNIRKSISPCNKCSVV